MKIVAIITTIVLFSFSSYSQDFRNISWGMSQKEVLEKETFNHLRTLDHSKNSTAIIFNGELSGDSVHIWYYFLYDTLYASKYDFYASSTGLEPYSQLIRYLDILKRKYEEPDQMVWDWEGEDLTYFINYEAENPDTEFSFLFGMGDLKKVIYQWETSKTIVTMSVLPYKANNNFRMPTLEIGYKSWDSFRLTKKFQQEYSLENF